MSARAKWVASCIALTADQVRDIAVHDRGLCPELARELQQGRFAGWAWPHLWIWGGNATSARYLAIPKAGSSSVREAMRSSYGLRDRWGGEWQESRGMFREDASHWPNEAQRSWFGWTLVDDPVSHFIGGWATQGGKVVANGVLIRNETERSHCADVPEYLEMLNSTTPDTRKRDVHLAPQLLIIRSAIAQGGSLSFVGHLPDIATEWGRLRTAMEDAGARPFARALPHLRNASSQPECRAQMGAHGSAQTVPPASLRILCSYLLEDFVCLDFPFPDACLLEPNSVTL